VQNTDYTVTLGDPFDTFTITPLAPLLTKINALIAGSPSTEINRIVVRRQLDFLTSITPALARQTNFLSREIDRAVMRELQLNDALARTVRLSETFSGTYPDVAVREVPSDVSGTPVVVWLETGGWGAGPDTGVISDAAGNAQAAATSATQAASHAAAAAAQGASAAASATQAAASAASINPALFLTKEDNLASVASKGTARTNLGMSDVMSALVSNDSLPIAGDISVTTGLAAQGAYSYLTGSGSSGGPDGHAFGVVLHLRRTTAVGDVQIFVSQGTGDIYTRCRTGGGWQPWLGGRATQAQAEAGTDTVSYMNALGTAQAIAARAASYAVLTDTKAQGTLGQTNTANTWTSHDINTTNYDPDSIVTVSNPNFQFSKAGYVRISMVARDNQALRLYDVTNSAVVTSGSSVSLGIGGGGHASVIGTYAVEADTDYRVEFIHNGTAQAPAVNFSGRPEIYLLVEFYG